MSRRNGQYLETLLMKALKLKIKKAISFSWLIGRLFE
jgi:hypothetical protein